MEDVQYGELNPRHEGRLNKKKKKFLPPPTKLQPFKKGVRFFAAPTVQWKNSILVQPKSNPSGFKSELVGQTRQVTPEYN